LSYSTFANNLKLFARLFLSSANCKNANIAL